MYTVNDFFCGCGGLGLGLQKAGFKILKAWDFDRFAVQTYRENIGDHVEQADIKELHIEDIPKATAWAFGFPCQDLSVAGKQAGIKLECTDCGEVWEVDSKHYTGENACPKCGGGNYRAATRSGMFFEIMRLLQEAAEKEPDKLPKILIAENVKALGPYLPVLAAEYSRAGYKSYYQLFNSKWWGVPQNRERFIVVGIRDTLEGAYRYPAEQHEWIPKLSSVLEKDVPESFYIDDDKARKIIDQALQRLAKMGNVHAAITPDRVSKRQNGRRAKEDEEEMFALTAQDLHGVIQRQRKELVPPGDTCASALIHSRGLETRQDGISHCIKGGGGGSGANFLVEKVPPPITEVCVNDRGFTEKDPQVSSVAPTLRAENHGNHPKIIEERLTEVCVDNRNFRKKAMENGYGASVGVAPALLSSDYNGPKVVIEERSTPPRSLERAIEDGIAQKQRNGGGTFIGTSPTLLSTDYKGPHVVIEKKEGNSETT